VQRSSSPSFVYAVAPTGQQAAPFWTIRRGVGDGDCVGGGGDVGDGGGGDVIAGSRAGPGVGEVSVVLGPGIGPGVWRWHPGSTISSPIAAAARPVRAHEFTVGIGVPAFG
jgi:hypothetical protein